VGFSDAENSRSGDGGIDGVAAGAENIDGCKGCQGDVAAMPLPKATDLPRWSKFLIG
jgi:hypothetical protein